MSNTPTEQKEEKHLFESEGHLLEMVWLIAARFRTAANYPETFAKYWEIEIHPTFGKVTLTVAHIIKILKEGHGINITEEQVEFIMKYGAPYGEFEIITWPHNNMSRKSWCLR